MIEANRRDQLEAEFDRHALLPVPPDDDDSFRDWSDSLSSEERSFVHLRARTLELRLRRMAASTTIRPERERVK